MATKRKLKEQSGKLSLTPSLEPAYVREQLQDAVRTHGGAAIEIPEELILSVSKTRNPAKLAEASEALSKIAESAGKSPGKCPKEAFAALGNKEIARAFARKPEKVAKAFIRIMKAAGNNAGHAFAAIGKGELAAAFSTNMGTITDAMVSLGKATKAEMGGIFGELATNAELSFLLAQKPESFIRIADAAGSAIDMVVLLLSRNGYAPILLNKTEEITDAFVRIASEAGKNASAYFFGLQDFAGLFAEGPESFAESYLEAVSICGRRKSAFFGLLTNKDVSDAISADPSRLKKLAEAMTYSTIHLYLEDGKGKNGEKMPELIALLDEPGRLVREYGIPNLAGYRGKWRKGAELAREAGIIPEGREMPINFAYAEGTIGRKKTIAIHKEYGIEYFARYTKEELENLYGQISREVDERPLLIIANNKSDYNYSFYGEATTRAPLTEGDKYNVIIFEAGTEGEFYEKAKKFGEKYFGISALIIGGHGSAEEIRLGHGDGEEALLDLSDITELKNLHGLFAENLKGPRIPIVVLNSCSTGEDEQAIGARISDAWGAVLIAPDVPTSIREFIFDEDGNLIDAVYRKGGKRFLKGKELPIRR